MRRLISMLTGACLTGGVLWLACAVPVGAAGSLGTVGSVVAYAQSAHAATLSSGTTSCVASTGCTMSLTGSGFGPSETVDLTLHSTPSSLGTVSTDHNGDFATTVTIPAGVPPGAHTIVAIGETSGETASFPFTITAETVATVPTTTPPSPPATTAVPSSPSQSASLPFTGLDVSAVVAIAVIAAGAGAVGLLTSRLRRLRRGERLRG